MQTEWHTSRFSGQNAAPDFFELRKYSMYDEKFPIKDRCFSPIAFYGDASFIAGDSAKATHSF